MRTLIVVLLVLSGCNPQLEGARCLTSDNCPYSQVCGRGCTCSVASSDTVTAMAQTGTCGGYRLLPNEIRVEAFQSDVRVQVSADGQLIATNRNGASPTSNVFRHQADDTWSSVSVVDAAIPYAVALAPSGTSMAAWFQDKVQVLTVGTAASAPVDVWFRSPNAIALGARTVVASFPALGVWRKQVGDDTALDGGTQLDDRPATALSVSYDGGVIAAQFGSEVRVFGGPLGNPDGGATSFADVRAFALSGFGSVLALAGTDGGVRVATPTVTKLVTGEKVRDVALDGDGRTLVLMRDDPFVLYQTRVWTRRVDEWTQVGEVAMTNDASHLALSQDGETLVISVNSLGKLFLFEKVQ